MRFQEEDEETDIAENADINFKLVTGVTYDISKKKKKVKKKKKKKNPILTGGGGASGGAKPLTWGHLPPHAPPPPGAATGGSSLATLMAGNAKEADIMIWGICARSARQI